MEDILLSKLQVRNFRNLSDDILSFSDGINCIFGQNGNGKTNILEAIYYLINHKSFRKKTGFPQLLSMDSEEPEILFNSFFNNQTTYTGKLNQLGQTWYLDNQPHKKKLEVKAVFINPFDSFTFHNQSSFRRQWFDQHIGLANKAYKKVLNKYQTALRFRNALLGKNLRSYDAQMAAIDDQIADYTLELIEHKISFLERVNGLVSEVFKKIFEEAHNLRLSLECEFTGCSKEQIIASLQNNFAKDNAIGHTTIGSHRDDYMFEFDGMNSYEYCSLGQQKMSYLSLIFAFIEVFKSVYGVYPMVLIDDVSGELDSLRWKNLIEYLETKKLSGFHYYG
jgi:DNA replication and repair protein RecF